MRYRYQDPSKIPKWKKYGRLGFLCLTFHMTGYFLIKRAFGNKDGTSTMTEINANIRNAHFSSLGKVYQEGKAMKVRLIQVEGLTVVKNEETTLSEIMTRKPRHCQEGVEGQSLKSTADESAV